MLEGMYSLLDWAPFRQTEAAIKLHTLLDLRGPIPVLIHISDGKLHDVNVLDMLTAEAGALRVMDRGYLDFARLYRLHQAGAFLVTRAKSNFNAWRVPWAPCDRTSGAICDQRVALNGFYAARQVGFFHLHSLSGGDCVASDENFMSLDQGPFRAHYNCIRDLDG